MPAMVGGSGTSGALAQAPRDPYTNQPFAYARTPFGYTLYGAGNDQQLNGGFYDDFAQPGGDLVLHNDQSLQP